MQPGLQPEPVPTGTGAAIMHRAEDLTGVIRPQHCFFSNFWNCKVRLWAG